MRLTHLGHACLLIESATTRLLIDPGVYSADFTRLTGVDAILVTHQHPDHLDTERLPALLAANPGARLLTEPEAAELLRSRGDAATATPFAGDQSVGIGDLVVEGVGDRHALIHDGVPRIGNTGFVISGDDEPALFHPGDAYDAVPGRTVDVLALPLNAPWAAVQDTLDFARRLAPRWVVPIHDGLLNETGRRGYLMHVETFTPKTTQVKDLSDGLPWDVG